MTGSYLKNILKNVFYLIKSLAKYNSIDWRTISNESIHVEVDKQSYVTAPYHLYHTKIGYGTAIGKNSYISLTKIGKFCSIGPNVLCGWGIHPLNGISINPAFYSTKKQNGFTFSSTDKINERKHITIGNDVFIGANVTILDGVIIGDGAVIGAGAVVSKDIPAYAIAVGCPIKVIKYRFEPEIIKELLEVSWWDKDEEILRMVETDFFDINLFLQKVRLLSNQPSKTYD